MIKQPTLRSNWKDKTNYESMRTLQKVSSMDLNNDDSAETSTGSNNKLETANNLTNLNIKKISLDQNDGNQSKQISS